MKREVKELFTKAERTKKQLDEMMAELDDSLIKLVNDEISVEAHKAMSKAVENVQKAWKQQMNIALKSLLLARREAASKWGARPYDKYIVKGDIRGLVSSHLTVDDAIKAAKRDRERCKHLGAGAYSDVLVYRIDLDGELHAVDEDEYEKQKE